MIRGILFDLDNTLIDRDAAMRRALIQRLGTTVDSLIDEIVRRDNSGFEVLSC